MPDAPHTAPSLARRALAAAVGLFATWQLIYVPAANLIDFVPRRPNGPDLEPIYDNYQAKGAFTSVEPVQRAAEWAGDALDFWTEATGQEQGWAMFAPGPPPYCAFPATEFHFADGTADTVLSAYEPIDKANPRPRLPLWNNRPFNVEAQFMYPVWYAPPEQVARHPDYYRDLHDAARVWQGLVRAWLAVRLKEYRAAHPDRPAPIEVILKHRYISTPAPRAPAVWATELQERPFARWRPADGTYEAYDAVNGRFVSVGASR
jgi:hypothetical protein